MLQPAVVRSPLIPSRRASTGPPARATRAATWDSVSLIGYTTRWDAIDRADVQDIAADLNVNPETLRTWVREAEGSAAVGPQDAQAELARLPRPRRS
ncbi:transposase [Streptomyces sp. 900105245]